MKTHALAVAIASAVACLAHANSPQPGEMSPPLGIEHLLNAPDNTSATLEALRGNVVVLEFWATWCGPCVAAIPHMNELTEAFKDRDVVFISVSDEKREVIERFQKRGRPKIDGWIGLDTDQSLLRAYEVRGIPHTVVLDGYGRVASITDPWSLTAERLEAFLTGHRDTPEHAAPPPPDADTPDAAEAPVITFRSTWRAGLDPLDMVETPPLYQVIVRRTPEEAKRFSRGAGMGNARTSTAQPVNHVLANLYGTPIELIDIEGIDEDVRYDMIATEQPGKDFLKSDAIRDMILADLGATVSTEQRVLNGYRLVEAASGHTLDDWIAAGFRQTGPRLIAPRGTAGVIAGWVQSTLGVVVEDGTALGDTRFSIDLGTTSQKTVEEMRSILTEQAGLDLVPATFTREVVVVRPTADAQPQEAQGG